MDRRLWLDIAEREDFSVFVDSFAGDLPGGDFTKQAINLKPSFSL